MGKNNGKETKRQDTSSESASSLLYLYTNNSIQTPETVCQDEDRQKVVNALIGALSPYYRKSAFTLKNNVQRLISLAASPGHVGFLTLTFPDNVTDHREAYKRFRSFNSNFLAPYPHVSEWISTKERQTRGAWHYHLAIQTTEDIRSGFDWDEYNRWIEDRKNGTVRRLQTGNEDLRRLWKDFRSAMKEYGLGRSELLPIRSNEEGLARYLGKYISKHIGQRKPEDKGVRLVNSSRGWTKNNAKFAWNTEGAKEWRRKLKIFAGLHGCDSIEQLSFRLGKNWVYQYWHHIAGADRLLERMEQKIPF